MYPFDVGAGGIDNHSLAAVQLLIHGRTDTVGAYYDHVALRNTIEAVCFFGSLFCKVVGDAAIVYQLAVGIYARAFVFAALNGFVRHIDSPFYSAAKSGGFSDNHFSLTQYLSAPLSLT